MSDQTLQQVLGFTPPEPLRRYAQVTLFAGTPEAFEEFRGTLLDAGHDCDGHVAYSDIGEPFEVIWWSEGEVWCSVHGPRGYKR